MDKGCCFFKYWVSVFRNLFSSVSSILPENPVVSSLFVSSIRLMKSGLVDISWSKGKCYKYDIWVKLKHICTTNSMDNVFILFPRGRKPLSLLQLCHCQQKKNRLSLLLDPLLLLLYVPQITSRLIKGYMGQRAHSRECKFCSCSCWHWKKSNKNRGFDTHCSINGAVWKTPEHTSVRWWWWEKVNTEEEL